MTKPALAVPYTFSQAGWNGGGEITGNFEIDLDYPTPTPGVFYVEALTGFHAHWSGNVYSQPYDWDLSHVSLAHFLFASDSIIDMVLEGDVQYDAVLPLVWDLRPGAMAPDPNSTLAQYYATGPLTVTRVPDSNNTIVLLAAALLFLLGFSRNFQNVRHASPHR